MLQYKPIKVLSVKDHTLKTTYTEGIDYVVDSANHSLTFPSGSRIKAIDSRAARSTGTNQFVDQINTSFGSNYSYHASNPGYISYTDVYTGYYTALYGVTYNEAMLFPQTYLNVTYVYDPNEITTTNNPFVNFDSNYLTSFRSVLNSSKQDIKILSIGDSISSGCNASGGLSGFIWPFDEPYQKPYQLLVAEELGKLYNKNVTVEFSTYGGTTSAWPLSYPPSGEQSVIGTYGGEVLDAALSKADYDLCIIAYGMNDAGGNRSASAFQNNISQTCAKVLNDSPNCNFILMNSFPRNPVASANIGSNVENLLRTEYLNALQSVQTSLGNAKCRVLDMHAVGDYYLGIGKYTAKTYNKKYFEISGSNMNHPNDFFHRMYASQVLSAVHNYDTVTYQQLFNQTSTVTFNSNGGSSVSSQTIAYNGTATKPTNPTKSGYTFVGWYKDSALTTAFNFSTPITADTTLYAKWQQVIVSYSVSFNSNGGSSVASQTINSGSLATRPTNPTKTGYTFVGWYKDSALTNQFNFNTPITANTTLYAKWQQNAPAVTTYTVTFNSNGGSSVASQTINSGALATRPTNPTKAGYTFVGWYTNSGLTNQFNFNTPITANTTLYAKWQKNADEGSESTISCNSNVAGTSIAISLSALLVAGCIIVAKRKSKQK